MMMNSEDAPVQNKIQAFDSAVFLWNGKFLFFRKSISSLEHKHHAIQICIGLEEPIQILSNKKILIENRIVLIDSGAPHTVKAPDARHAFLFLEPELNISQLIREKYFRNKKIIALDYIIIKSEAQRLSFCYDKTHSCSEVNSIIRELLFKIAGENKVIMELDYRIKKVLDLLANTGEKVSSRQLANASNLSGSRLQHLFKEQVGIPIRQYLLWRRLIHAIQQIAKLSIPNPLTDAAYMAGFSDSAHFSRTFKRMFGITPTEILQSRQPGKLFSLYICD